MSYANNNGSLSVPQFISTVDLTTETKPKFVKYFYYTVFNFAKQFSNPLILPFPITLDVIYHGNIDVGANQFKSKTFAVEQVTGSKFNISGEGTAYFWYRYGSIDPASFNLIAQTAINNKDWLVLDAILHTRSFIEAIDFLVNNPQTWTIIAEGLDWQLNEIGARDLFAYLTNNLYDSRKLAQFLTILAYIDPDVLIKLGIPVYTYDNPNKTFEKYLEYLPASPFASIYSELSEQSSEISELFAQTSELNDEILVLGAQIIKLLKESSEHSVEISELFTETSTLDQEITQLSENLILFTQAGQIVNQVLNLSHLFKAITLALKIIQHTITSIVSVSEVGILQELGQEINKILAIIGIPIVNVSAEINVQAIIQVLINLLNELLGSNNQNVDPGSETESSEMTQSSETNSSQSQVPQEPTEPQAPQAPSEPQLSSNSLL